VPRKKKPKKFEFNAQALCDEVTEMVNHPRFRRYKLGVRQRGIRIVIYEGSRDNIKATFLPPHSGGEGYLSINDSLVNTMVRVAGGEQVHWFYNTWGPGKKPLSG
jgi:hypothetical protein